MAETLVGVAPGSGWHTERYDATRFMALHQGVPQCGIWWITWPSRQLMNCAHTVSQVPPGSPMPLCCAEGSKHCSAAVLQKSVSSAQDPKLRCGQYIIVGMRKLYAEVQAGFTTINFARRWTQRRGEGGRGRGVSPSVNIRH